MALADLPDDVLVDICEQLDTATLRNLAAAFVGHVPSVQSKEDCARVPDAFRTLWIVRCVVDDVDAYLRGDFGETCFCVAREGLTVTAFLDWSPFLREAPLPVATFRWVRSRACVAVDRVALTTRLLCAVRAKRPVAQVAAHIVTHWRDHVVLHPRPSLLASVPLVPHFMLSQQAAPALCGSQSAPAPCGSQAAPALCGPQASQNTSPVRL